MQVGVIGISHKLADLKLRDQLAKCCQMCFGALNSIQDNHYFILLSTCNRTEIYFYSVDLASTHTYILNILREQVQGEFDHKLYSYFGIDCLSHLSRVTAGLDSAIIAETEIQGQVKAAYELVCDYHELPSALHFLFQKAICTAKKIRSELQLGRGMPNLDHAIFQTGCHFFSKPENARILFVGASEINQKILTYLKSKKCQEITLCNRSETTARSLSSEYRLEVLEWHRLTEWDQYDWIIFGTKSPDYLITRQRSDHSQFSHKLVMDLCVPRNVDPKLAQEPDITLLNIDQLNRLLKIRKQRMNDSLALAESMVVAAARRHAKKFTVPPSLSRVG